MWASFRKAASDGVVPLGEQHLEGNMNPRSRETRTEDNLGRHDGTQSNLGLLSGSEPTYCDPAGGTGGK